jgi:spore germination protein GerM
LRRLILILVVIAIAAAAYWIVWERLRATSPLEEAAVAERVRTVTLYFGSSDGASLVAEHRTLASSEKSLDNLRNLVEALVAGPRGDGVAAMPASVRLRGVFMHDKTAVIDFSREIVDDFSGGTTAEYMLISSLVQTICANFPQVEAVRILVEGGEVESLGGHLSLSGPLRPQEWR